MLQMSTAKFFEMRCPRAQVECMNLFAADHEIKSGVMKTGSAFRNFFSHANFYGVIYAFVCKALVSVANLKFFEA
jgi:hypothetical protein